LQVTFTANYERKWSLRVVDLKKRGRSAVTSFKTGRFGVVGLIIASVMSIPILMRTNTAVSSMHSF
jgi:hypothetical protein